VENKRLTTSRSENRRFWDYENLSKSEMFIGTSPGFLNHTKTFQFSSMPLWLIKRRHSNTPSTQGLLKGGAGCPQPTPSSQAPVTVNEVGEEQDETVLPGLPQGILGQERPA
jgi:hypothetical protein